MKKKLMFTVIFGFIGLMCQGQRLFAKDSTALHEEISFLELAFNHQSPELGEMIEKFRPEDYRIDSFIVQTYTDRLVNLSLNMIKRGNTKPALDLLSKTLILDPKEWRAVSYIHFFKKDVSFFSTEYVRSLMQQVGRIFHNFEASVLLITQFLEAMIWAVMLTMLAFAIWFVRQYLSLGTIDMILDDKGLVDKKRLAIWCLLLLWPLFLGAGWIFWVIIILAALWFYTDAGEKKAIKILFITLTFMAVLASVNKFFVQQMSQSSFLQTKNIIVTNQTTPSRKTIADNNIAKLYLAYNFFRAGNLEEGISWLNSADDTAHHVYKANLYGYAFLANKEYERAISFFSSVLAKDSSDQTALYNMTLALLENKDEKVFEAYLNRFPSISTLMDKVTQPQLPPIGSHHLWQLFLSAGKKQSESTVFYVLKSVLINLASLPILYLLGVFAFYIRMLPRFFHQIGKSTHCTKCQKPIKKDKSSRAVNVCNDCYQLFLIKDAIMIDAKSFKEAEIIRSNRKKNIIFLFLSFLFPAFFLHMRGQHLLFAALNFFYFLFLLIALVVGQPLAAFNGTMPLFTKAFGFIAAGIFIVGNALVFRGDEYGV